MSRFMEICKQHSIFQSNLNRKSPIYIIFFDRWQPASLYFNPFLDDILMSKNVADKDLKPIILMRFYTQMW